MGCGDSGRTGQKCVPPPPPYVYVYCMFPTVTIIVIKDNPWSSASFFLNAWLHLPRLTFLCEAQLDHVKINSGKLKQFVHNIIHCESISFFLHFSLRDMRDVGVVPPPQSKKHQSKRKADHRMHMVREIKTEGYYCLQQLLMIMIYIETHLCPWLRVINNIRKKKFCSHIHVILFFLFQSVVQSCLNSLTRCYFLSVHWIIYSFCPWQITEQ